MSTNSSIEWTEATWNPTTGCTKVSAECAHCYAERMSHRLRGMGRPEYRDATDNKGRFTGTLTMVEDRLTEPLTWKKPRLVFVNSMSDLFHADIPVPFIHKVLGVIRACPQHTFQVLTKRPEKMLDVMGRLSSRYLYCDGTVVEHQTMDAWEWPMPNLWMGTSVGNVAAKARIDVLRQVPAAVRFLSIEPLLEDLGTLDLSGIHWVIVGGESGPGARPMQADWVRSIRDQCQAAGVPFFFKQWGGVQKKLAGRLLDGVEWNEMPIREAAHG